MRRQTTEVSQEIDRFSAELSRREIIEQSLENYGYSRQMFGLRKLHDILIDWLQRFSGIGNNA